MALSSIIRNLIAVWSFETDEQSLKANEAKVNASIQRIKTSITTVGAIVGAEFAFNTVKSMVTGFARGVRQLNKTQLQIGQILTPDIDLGDTMRDIFRIAQLTGQETNNIARGFRSLAISASEFGVNQKVALAATENITKAFEVQRLTSEEQVRGFEVINAALKRGGISARQVGEYIIEYPRLMELFRDATGRSNEQLREMAKQGQLTGKFMLEAFARVNKELEADFAAKPLTMGHAFTFVYNEIIRVGQALWRTTHGLRYIAQAIIWLTKTIVGWGETLVEWLGGAEQAIKLVEAAIVAAFGYYTVGLIISMIGYVRTLGMTALFAQLKFAAIALAIAGIVIAIEDIMTWFKGGKSITGGLIGRREDFEKNWKGVMDLFTGMGKLLKFDIGGFEDLWNGLGTTEGKVVALTAAITAAGVAFGLWNTISFAGGIISSLLKLIGVTKTVGVTANTQLELAFNNPNAGRFGGLTSALRLAIGAGIMYGLAKAIDEGLDYLTTEMQKITGVKPNEIRAGAESAGEATPEWVPNWMIPDWAARKKSQQGKDTTLPKPPVWVEPPPGVYIPSQFRGMEEIGDVIPAPPTHEPNPIARWLQTNIPWLMGGAATPNVPPGAVAGGGGVHIENNPNVPITNNVNVTVPVEFGELETRITGIVQDETRKSQEQIVRGLQTAMPRMEAATG